MAASVLTGQNLGAEASGRAEKIGWKDISFRGRFRQFFVAADLFSGPLKFPLQWQRTNWCLRDSTLPQSHDAVRAVLWRSALFLAGCLQGAGDTRGVMFVIVAALFLVRLPLAYILAIAAGYGAFASGWPWSVLCVFQGIAMTARFRKGRWKEIKL